jgi:ectoine hydroxylase-related dioxygenase (phytanoyl-CoA dioxygenase family)
MEHLAVTPQEHANGSLSAETLERACSQVALNGFAVLENVIARDVIDRVHDDWLELANHLLEHDREKTAVDSRDFRKNRIRMDIPFRRPYIDAPFIANAFVVPIVERLLGEDCRLFYYSADAPMPGSDYQVVHADYRPFFPESDAVLPPAGLAVNFPLVDVTEGNGPMEAWPNSHRMPEKAFVAKEALQDAARYLTPARMLTPRGSVLIRDIRMWHRGTPNNSNHMRPNLALVYGRSWWDGAFLPQETLGITRAAYESLSERAKQLVRLEPVAD